MHTFLALSLTLSSLLLHTAQAVNPVEIHGKFFYDSVTNDQLSIIGIDYQPGGSSAVAAGADPLTDEDACLRDFTLMQALGINVVRIYSVDNTLNHDYCMSVLNAAGMYLVLDVNSPLYGQHLDRSDPASTYTRQYIEHIYATIDAFKGYDNLLGFFSGNEVINDEAGAATLPPYLRAITRDMKEYIREQSDRVIPVGYSSVDIPGLRTDSSSYLSCNNGNPDEISDFFALNTYSWCGDATFQSSGYDLIVAEYADYAHPVFFSEYGCNQVLPRAFSDVATVYSSQMNEVVTGGLIYEFTQESNNYGLVQINSDGSVSLLPDFDTIQGVYSNISSFPTVPETTLTPVQCSAVTYAMSEFDGDLDIPTLSGLSSIISAGSGNTISGVLSSITATLVQAPVTDTSNSSTYVSLALSTLTEANRPGLVTLPTVASASGARPTASSQSASPTGPGASTGIRSSGASTTPSSTDSPSSVMSSAIGKSAYLLVIPFIILSYGIAELI